MLNPSTPLGFLKNNDDYFREVLTYCFNKELVLYSTFPFLEPWFILLLLHNHITSLWRVQQLLTWKSNIRKVCIFSCLLMWCSSWKQGGETVCGDLTALPTSTWEPLFGLETKMRGNHFLGLIMPIVPGTSMIQILCLCSWLSRVLFQSPPHDCTWQTLLMYKKRKFCEAFCLC